MNKQTVEEVVKTVGPLPFRVIGKWMIQICNALKAEIEGRGTDSFIPLSPALLIVNDSMNLKYDASDYIFHAPDKHALVAPPAYWSPEQARDKELSVSSTLYSLGVIAYEMTTGHLPFSTDISKADLLLAHMRVEAPKASSIRFDVPAVLESLIEKLLSKDSNDRFASPDEVAEAVSRMSFNEDSTGIKARKIMEGLFTDKGTGQGSPAFSIQTRVKDQPPGRDLDPEASRATVRMKIPVFNGTPLWEKDLRVTAHTGKATFTWITESAEIYSCKVSKRDSGTVVSHTSEDEASTDHKMEVSGLESGTSYSVTIFNEKDFVMRNFKTPVALI